MSNSIEDQTNYKTIFIDSNLDTHLALVVSDLETVSDLKNKIMFEHPLCFPYHGEIKLNALKVKCQEHLYHLSDSMPVKNAFREVNKVWFLHLDASSGIKPNETMYADANNSNNNILYDGHSQRLLTLNDSLLKHHRNKNQVGQEISNANKVGLLKFNSISNDLGMETLLNEDKNFKHSSTGVNKWLGKISENFEPLIDDINKDEIGDSPCCMDGELKIPSGSNKRRRIKKKKKKNEDVTKINASINKDALQPEITAPENLPGNASKGISTEILQIGDAHSKKLIFNKRKHSEMQKEFVSSIGTIVGTVPSGQTKKRHKIEKEKPVDSHLDEDSSKNVAIGDECTEIEVTKVDAHSQNEHFKSAKKKEGTKSKNICDEVITTVPSLIEAVTKEEFSEKAQIKLKDSCRKSGAAIIPEELSPKFSDAMSCVVQEVVEGGKVDNSSVGINTKKDDISELINASAVKKTRRSKRRSVNAEDLSPAVGQEPDTIKKDVMFSVDTDKIVDECQLPQNLKGILSEKCEPSTLCSTEKNVKVSIFSNTNVDVGTNSSGHIIKKSAKKAAWEVEHVNDFVMNKVSAEPIKKGASNLPQSETRDTSFLNAVNEAAKASEHEIEGMNIAQIDKTQENAAVEESENKNKNQRDFALEDLPQTPIKVQEVNTKEQLVSNNKTKKIDALTKVVVEKVATGIMSNKVPNSRKYEKKRDLLSAENLLDIKNHLKSNEGGNNNKWTEGNAAKVALKESLSEDKHRESINSANQKPLIVLSNEPNARSSHDVIVDSTTKETLNYNFSNSPDTNVVSGSEASIASTSSFKNSRKLTQSSKTVKEQKLHLDSSQVTAKKPTAISRLVLKGSSKFVNPNAKVKHNQLRSDTTCLTVRKTFNKNKEKVLNGSEHKKNLLAVSSALFKTDISHSSEEENGIDSDSKIQSPSSSGYSESEGTSKESLDANQNGFSGRKRSGDSKTDTSMVLKDMGLEMVLRNSRRFKKTKLIASQSQPDDFDTVDFIPEGQTDT